MSLEEKRRLILALDVLIRSKVRGKADYMARRLGISRSTFFRLIEYMREDLYAPLIFDASQSRYMYERDGIIMFRFLPAEVIDVEEAKKIVGGETWISCEKLLSSVSTVDTHCG